MLIFKLIYRWLASSVFFVC